MNTNFKTDYKHIIYYVLVCTWQYIDAGGKVLFVVISD